MDIVNSSSGDILFQVPIGVAVIIIVLLTALAIYFLYTICQRFLHRNQCNEDDEKCNYSACKELTKKDLRHAIIFFSTLLIFICVGLLTGDQRAMDYFSFASTITSIVLSVVAIIMTISSESKSEGVKHQIDKSVLELADAKKSIEEYNKNMKEHADSQLKIFESILQQSKENLVKLEELASLMQSMDKQLEEIRAIRQETLRMDNAQYSVEEDLH